MRKKLGGNAMRKKLGDNAMRKKLILLGVILLVGCGKRIESTSAYYCDSNALYRNWWYCDNADCHRIKDIRGEPMHCDIYDDASYKNCQYFTPSERLMHDEIERLNDAGQDPTNAMDNLFHAIEAKCHN